MLFEFVSKSDWKSGFRQKSHQLTLIHFELVLYSWVLLVFFFFFLHFFAFFGALSVWSFSLGYSERTMRVTKDNDYKSMFRYLYMFDVILCFVYNVYSFFFFFSYSFLSLSFALYCQSVVWKRMKKARKKRKEKKSLSRCAFPFNFSMVFIISFPQCWVLGCCAHLLRFMRSTKHTEYSNAQNASAKMAQNATHKHTHHSTDSIVHPFRWLYIYPLNIRKNWIRQKSSETAKISSDFDISDEFSGFGWFGDLVTVKTRATHFIELFSIDNGIINLWINEMFRLHEYKRSIRAKQNQEMEERKKESQSQFFFTP